MGDLLGFEGFLNVSTPFDAGEHDFVWKDTRRYHDFAAGNDWIPKCDYPRFWDAQGHLVTNLSHLLVGCRDSEFDQVRLLNLSVGSLQYADMMPSSMAKSLRLEITLNGKNPSCFPVDGIITSSLGKSRSLSSPSCKIVYGNGAQM